MKKILPLLLASVLCSLFVPTPTARAQGTALTYQGRLDDAAGPANGTYNFKFFVRDALTAGNDVGGTLAATLAVSNGLFTATLDPGAGVFTGADRWLEIAVRTNGAEIFTTLSPRQKITATPYAQYAPSAGTAANAASVAAANITGTIPPANIGVGSITTASLADGAVTAAKISGLLQSSQIPTLDAATKLSGTLPDARLSTNVALLNRSNQEFTGLSRFSQRIYVLNGMSVTGDILTFDGNGVLGGNIYGNIHGNGAGLINLNASSIASNTVARDFHCNTLIATPRDTNRAGGVIRLLGSQSNTHTNKSWYLDNLDGNIRVVVYEDGVDSYNALSITQTGAIGIGTDTPSQALDVAGEVVCTAMNLTSDRNAKEQFQPVNARAVLDKVARLPISEWQYKTQADVRHIGPMAQDFRAAFALGRDDKHITSVDADGVALAAIQGLNEKLEEQGRAKDTQIKDLERSIETLQHLVKDLARQQNGGAK